MWLLLVLACPGDPSSASCDDLPTAPRLAACFGSETLDWNGYGTAALAVDGEIVSVERGPFPAACDVRFSGEGGGDATIVVVEAGDGSRTTVGVDVAEAAGRFTVGEQVQLDVSYTFGEFGPDTAWVEVRDGAGEDLLVVATAGEVAGLRVPAGVTATEGEALCTAHDECGDWSAFPLDVAVGGEDVVVGYGATASVGGWTVAHGGLERQAESDGGSCPDWFVAHVAAAFVRD